MEVSEQDTPALDSSDHTFTPTKHMVRRERSLGQEWMSVSTCTVCASRSIAAINSQNPILNRTSAKNMEGKGKAYYLRGNPVVLSMVQ